MRFKTIFLLVFFTITSTVHSQVIPYPWSPVIIKVEFNWDSHLRLAPGSDNWPVTWADNDKQYTVWGDGGGFGGTNSISRSSIGLACIEGPWSDFKPTNIWGGYNTKNIHNITGKSYGIVCVNRFLYMWVGMLETNTDPFKEVKIAYSKDYGETWEFAEWSFYRADDVMMPTFCNYGKNYNQAKDEFVYSYLIRFQSYEGPDNYEDKVDWLNCQKPGIIDLARVHKDSIFIREAYSFYKGMKNNKPDWTKEIGERIPVFENKDGVGWCVSVIYNTGLDRYILTTEHTETHRGNLGIFDAPEPWGPWTTVLYENKWGKDHIPVNTFFWNFSNKWTSQDGTNFSLIFSGRKENDSFNVLRGKFITEKK
jgi:hypothetical protein